MREPPAGLSEETLRASLSAEYGLSVAELTFLPLGHDSWAWVYRVRTIDGTPYFLKVFQRVIAESSLLVPRCLHDQGITRVIAPLPTATETLRTAVDGYTLVLYPFVSGTSGMAQGMTPPQWIAYGKILRQIHAATLPPDLAQLMSRETFTPPGAELVRELEAHIREGTFADSGRNSARSPGKMQPIHSWASSDPARSWRWPLARPPT